MFHQLAHRFGKMRDVLPQGGQIPGEIFNGAFSAFGHGNLQHGSVGDSNATSPTWN
jgi:hypothetical protein